jgi:5,10-methylenetetrahydrofolate reductase
MAKVTDVAFSKRDGPAIICDYTPPRGGDPALLDGAKDLAAADYIAVAYNPGKLVRADSAAAALAIKQRFGTDVVFNLSPRDMNKLALQSRLAGAQLLGLENVLVLQGDPLTERDGAAAVNEYTASGLVAGIAAMNQGTDLKGSNLRAPTDFCIGASADLNRGVRAEAELTARKVAAGAHFLVTQPIFAASEAREFLEAYAEVAGSPLSIPVFWGLQLLRADGVLFSNVPRPVLDDLEKGRDGVEIAAELYAEFASNGIDCMYLVAPIMKGGARDYEAAGALMRQVGR